MAGRARTPSRTSALDLVHMKRALALAARAAGRTSPNPLVGAVVVGKHGRVLAEGYHHRAGADHGEVDALRKLSFDAPGATLYVTLEPCDHQGRTGPCTEVVLRSRVARVVVGMRDPNPGVNGRGIEKLRRHGLRVDVGLREDEARVLNRAWVTFITQRRPFVTLKAAITLDGYLATASGDSRWVTGEAARAEVHRLRDRSDAVLVGAGTVRADDPLLTTRLPSGRGHDPLRVVLDGRLSTPPNAKLLTEGAPPVLIVTTRVAPAARAAALGRTGAEVVVLGGRRGRVDLGELMAELARRGVVTLLCEGGGEVHHQLLAARLCDELCLFVAPRLLGGSDGVPLFRGPGASKMAEAVRLRVQHRRLLGGDMMIIATPEF